MSGAGAPDPAPAPVVPSSRWAGDRLVVTTRGGTMIATDGMLAYADGLRRVAAAAEEALRVVRVADAETDAATLGAMRSGLRAEGRIDRARDALGRARELAERVAGAVTASARHYREADARAGALAHRSAATGAAMLGSLAFLARLVNPLPAALLPLLLPAVVETLWPARAGKAPGDPGAVGGFLTEHPEVLTNPLVARLVRLGVTSVDEFANTATGVPPWLAIPLGDEEHGVAGVETSGLGLMAVGAVASGGRLFAETPVSVERTAERRFEIGASPKAGGTAPIGAAERLTRVPEHGRVRIERYEAPGMAPRYVVYVGPTETFSPVSDRRAWDMTSNVGGVVGVDAGSIRAVEQAMTDAGITSEDEVQLVGFSQGGLVAGRIAASSEWNAVGLETYGAPLGTTTLDGSIRGFEAVHTDDIVPATAGPREDAGRMLIQREAYPEGVPIPNDLPAPAHQLRAYLETARAVDRAQSAAVRDEVAALDAFTADVASAPGATLTVAEYRGYRER